MHVTTPQKESRMESNVLILIRCFSKIQLSRTTASGTREVKMELSDAVVRLTPHVSRSE